MQIKYTVIIEMDVKNGDLTSITKELREGMESLMVDMKGDGRTLSWTLHPQRTDRKRIIPKCDTYNTHFRGENVRYSKFDDK